MPASPPPVAQSPLLPFPRLLRRPFLYLGCLAVLAGCDWGSGPSRVPAAVEVVEGAGQTGTVFQPVAVRPAIRVVTGQGKPVKGEEVVFSVASGGGQVSGNVVETDGKGVARVGTWILGTSAGEQSLQVRVANLPLFTISAMAEPAGPSRITVREGNEQTGVVGRGLDTPPRVLVTDVYGNPVPGATVGFSVVEGSGRVVDPAPSTDGEGMASPGVWTLGRRPGPNRLSASIEGLVPATFRATATPDAPDRATVLLGDGQVGQVGSTLPLRPTLVIADRFGNLLGGIQVTFAVLSGGGSIVGSEQVSEPSGVVVGGPWTLGPEAGTQTLQVSVAGLDPLVLSAAAEPGPPARILANSGQAQTSIVGDPVPVLPTARVADVFGNPIAGVEVVFSLTLAPGDGESPGILLGPEVLTDTQGLGSPEGWTLGTVAGTYGVEARIQEVAQGVEFLATGLPDAPAALSIVAGDGQSTAAGSPVSVGPAVLVQDRFGNPAPAIPVAFGVVEGGGAVSPASVLTNQEGVATLETWTLGPGPGQNRLVAEVDGAGAVEFRATGLSATPAALVKVGGDGQTVTVGTEVAIAPRVQVTDALGNPVPDVPVDFEVVVGAGTIGASRVPTDANGYADVGSWLLGTTSGPQNLSASYGDLPAALFSATAVPGAPALLSYRRGDGQEALVGTYVPIPPAVRVRDEHGNPVPGVTVGFSVVGGGGSVSGGNSATDGSGIAKVERWTLGPVAGENRLRAGVSGLGQLDFQATGHLPGGFHIELKYLTTVEPSQAAVFDAAGARWEEIVVGDVSDFHGTLSVGGCQPEAVEGGIDDVRIYVAVRPIDGSGGVLGRAGPCYYRRSSPGVSPITGIMEFDEADLTDLEASGLLEDVIVHEMGHVLGFGTLWNAGVHTVLVNAGSSDPYFTGTGAVLAFDESGGEARLGSKVPVENTGGAGTRDSHWRETVHNAELMTGWIEPGGVLNPLSIITIASLADLGYAVNMLAADPYTLFDPQGVAGQDSPRNLLFLRELPAPIPIPVDLGGG